MLNNNIEVLIKDLIMESSVEPETLSEAVVIYLFAAAKVLMVLLRVWDGPKIALADRTHFHILRIFGD